jgi:UDPglucose--hexose-1-phosphate uridylyltransferase
VFAPVRGGRPGAWLPEIEPATNDELERCPFCGGREDRTPPEVLRLGDNPWRVRVVPNLYPAFERQEVVIHSPEHIRSFADVPEDHLPLIAQAWIERNEAFDRERAQFAYALINEGRLAGASLAHSHSQLVALTDPTPAETAEKTESLQELLEHDELVVATATAVEEGDVAALVHPFGAAPYECLIVPREPFVGLGGVGNYLAASLHLLRTLVRAVQAAEGRRPWNAWFHVERAHAHFVPRLTAYAGIELGAGLYVNVLPPEVAAERLRM